MRVIWKRPDGFLGASPEDFKAIELEGHSRLWVHRSNQDQYPFQVSGGWEEQKATQRLNNLINLLPEGDQRWLDYLSDAFAHNPSDNPKDFVRSWEDWLGELITHVKGDTWEAEILEHALRKTRERLELVAPKFEQKARL